jgi:hypothetical protein
VNNIKVARLQKLNTVNLKKVSLLFATVNINL